MKIFDMHVHALNTKPTPEKLISEIENSGIYGCCVFSNRPEECDKKTGSSFEARLEEVTAWTDGRKDRLFPVLWIHPYENDISKKIQRAVDAKIDAFKMICTNFDVYEDGCIRVLSEIAETGKPVIFHSGILWNGLFSSIHNRPLNWERLIEVKKLRFSMGHCSWPWIDECIALYGKFLNAYAKNENAPEMFFDITPGTPAIYRRELLTKLFTVGYDVPDNIMFGTDSYANKYSPDWASSWIARDNAIYDELGVGEDIQKKIYGDNLLRFLGKREKDFKHLSPAIDNANAWTVNTKR